MIRDSSPNSGKPLVSLAQPPQPPTGLLEKIIDGLLDEPAAAKPSSGASKTAAKSKTSASGKKVAGQAIAVADDVASIMGFPTISQFATLATDAYTLIESSNLSGLKLFGGRCRLFPARRSVRYVQLAP